MEYATLCLQQEQNCYQIKVNYDESVEINHNGKEKVGIKKLKITKGFIDYSQTIDYVYENLEEYDPTKKRRV